MTKDQELWYKLTVLKPEYYDILDYDVEIVTENHYNDVLSGRSYNGQYRSLLSSECGFDSCTPDQQS